MRQLIARIDDELHARLKRRARREGRSLNSLVLEALETAVRDEGHPRETLRRRARSLGYAAPVPGPPPDPEARRSLIERTTGLGSPVADELERERRSERR